MDYVLTLKDHVLFPLAVFFVIVALIIIVSGFLCGWFHKCSQCGSRLTLTGAYDEDIPSGSRTRTFRECLSCKYQEDLPLPRFPYHSDS